MKTSIHRLLTTHTGSLPRPEGLLEALGAGYEDALREAVREVVERQVAAGIDIVSDGEMSKPSYATYITERVSGFGGQGEAPMVGSDAEEFPEWAQFQAAALSGMPALPACVDELERTDGASVRRDIVNLRNAVAAGGAVEGFMTAASPGVIALFLDNQHYATHDDYLTALTDIMREEYNEIYQAGITVQLDCPDLAAGRHHRYRDMDLGDWKKLIEGHVEAINAATSDIPPGEMRLHLCWGNYGGPHNHDVPLNEILDIVLKARPAALSFEAANPRHAHEWRVFERITLPDDKVLIPGVIDSTTNYIEHRELVAERLVRFAKLVGRERVIAGTDCGFGTFAFGGPVMPSIAYAKLKSLAEGAALATEQLW